MRSDVAADLGDSAHDFMRVVWPAISRMLDGGRLDPVESTAPAGLRQDLDVLAGIDAWQMVDHRGVMRGIASRVQWGDRNWRTFTIRKSRPGSSQLQEYDKRLAAIDHPEQGWLFPALTVQAYISEPRRTGSLMGVGVIYTRDLFEYARRHSTDALRYAKNGGQGFLKVGWDDLRRAGVRVGEWPQRGGPSLAESASLINWLEGPTEQVSLFDIDGGAA